MKRSEVLEQAHKIVCNGREQDYGNPENNFETIARMWSAYIAALPKDDNGKRQLYPKDVAAMLVLLKSARIASGHAKADNWVDIAGYAACGGELEG